MHNVETTSKKPSRHFYGIAKLAVKSLDRELFLVAFSFYFTCESSSLEASCENTVM